MLRVSALLALPLLAAAQPVQVVLATDLGMIEIAVDTVHAPATAANFLRYVDAGRYDGGVFHRTVKTNPDNQPANQVKIDVIQGGVNPAREREAFPPIPLERNSQTGLKHLDGVISMARAGADTATSDFFLCIGDQPSLDFGGARNPDGQGFAAFGRVTRGMDVVRRIQAAPAAAQSLTPPVKITRAYRKLRAAFLGASHAHGVEKVRQVLASPEFELAGVCEPSAAVRARLDKLGVRYLDRAAVLNDKSIPVVFVESAVADHARDAIAALSAGKHVHLEKAPATDMAEFRQVVELARASKLHLQLGYMWRSNPAFNKVLEAVRNGWLGQVYLVHARINNLATAAQRTENGQFAGGQMFELGPHLCDIVVRLLGRPVRVTPFLRHDGAFADKFKDNTAAVLEFPNAMAVLTSATLQPYSFPHRTLEVFGTNGNAVVRPIEPPALEIELAQAAGPYHVGRQTIPLPKYERYIDDINLLARTVRGEATLGVTLDEELAIQETLLRASGMWRE
jgi:peptidyl-prolyl cis-trans isomerase A (cyclophilin A)